MTYEDLLREADKNKLIAKEKKLPLSKGRIKGNKIAIRCEMSNIEKKCVLAEELGHYHTTVGGILDQSIAENRKQELHARVWAYNRLIGLSGILDVYKAGCKTCHDMANYLDITEEFLNEAIAYYKQKYGLCVSMDNYIIYFEPCLSVFELV